jgi:hypothetical protein
MGVTNGGLVLNPSGKLSIVPLPFSKAMDAHYQLPRR